MEFQGVKWQSECNTILVIPCQRLVIMHTVIWFIFVLKIISVFNFGGDLISFL